MYCWSCDIVVCVVDVLYAGDILTVCPALFTYWLGHVVCHYMDETGSLLSAVSVCYLWWSHSWTTLSQCVKSDLNFVCIHFSWCDSHSMCVCVIIDTQCHFRLLLRLKIVGYLRFTVRFNFLKNIFGSRDWRITIFSGFSQSRLIHVAYSTSTLPQLYSNGVYFTYNYMSLFSNSLNTWVSSTYYVFLPSTAGHSLHCCCCCYRVVKCSFILLSM